jgi:hypothetical protein
MCGSNEVTFAGGRKRQSEGETPIDDTNRPTAFRLVQPYHPYHRLETLYLWARVNLAHSFRRKLYPTAEFISTTEG